MFWTFPHALIILTTALGMSDARLYEAAAALQGRTVPDLLTVTLPGVRYGLVSAVLVVFTLVITDFGVPKVVGGQYNVLATDMYKQVVGQQNFQMGAVVGLVLLLPAVLAFAVDRFVQRRQAALLSARAVPLAPKKDRTVDRLFLLLCTPVAFAILAIIGGGVLRLARDLLALQPHAVAQELRLRHDGWRRLGELPQLAHHGGTDRRSSALP